MSTRLPQEEPGKTIGLRAATRVVSGDVFALQRTVAELAPTCGFCQRGLHRFASFEEADRWLMREMTARARAYRRAKTSFASP